MNKQIVVTCLNDNKKYQFQRGISLFEVYEKIKPKLKFPALGARVNNEPQEMDFELYKSKHVEFIDITDYTGWQMYSRSACFILIKAFKDIFPKSRLKITHSICGGLYCEPEDFENNLTPEDVQKVKNRMLEIIKADIPFVREEVPNDEAIEIYRNHKQYDKCLLFKNRKLFYTSVYFLEDTVDYFYGYLVPSTGYITLFDIIHYKNGILLLLPKQSSPDVLENFRNEEKMFTVCSETKKWAKILKAESVGQINELIINNSLGEIIKISEALHEKKIANIADEIYKRKDKVKLILISGPSSSGKTSTCKRLSIQLKVLGFNTFMISLDDYFVDREYTPRDEKGDYDFECLEAIDVELFNKNLIDLINNKEVCLPKFDFTQGKKIFSQKPTKVEPNTLFIIEGIHGLNPALTSYIDKELKFKVYVSALTSVSLDDHNRIPTSDNRLLRRIVRDYKYRGYSAVETLKRWASVRKGEEKNIFPYQEEADAIFNSALIYEISFLKRYALPLLQEVPQKEVVYAEANRLEKFLSYFLEVPQVMEKEIPPTSILREFLGGSTFKY